MLNKLDGNFTWDVYFTHIFELNRFKEDKKRGAADFKQAFIRTFSSMKRIGYSKDPKKAATICHQFNHPSLRVRNAAHRTASALVLGLKVATRFNTFKNGSEKRLCPQRDWRVRASNFEQDRHSPSVYSRHVINDYVFYRFLLTRPGASIRCCLSSRKNHRFVEKQLRAIPQLRIWKTRKYKLTTGMLSHIPFVARSSLSSVKAGSTVYAFWVDYKESVDAFSPSIESDFDITANSVETRLLGQTLFFTEAQNRLASVNRSRCREMGAILGPLLNWTSVWDGWITDTELILITGDAALSVQEDRPFSRITLLYHPHHSPRLPDIIESHGDILDGVAVGSAAFDAHGVPFPDLVQNPHFYFYCAGLKFLTAEQIHASRQTQSRFRP